MKGQSQIIQVVLFFTIGLFVFLTLGNFFKLQLDIFSDSVSGESRKLFSGFITADYVVLKNCKSCDTAISTFQAQSSSNFFLQSILDKNGLSVASQPNGQVLVTSMHNLVNSLASASGSAADSEKMGLFFSNLQNSLTIFLSSQPPEIPIPGQPTAPPSQPRSDWLVGWSYRKPVTVSNSGSSLTDYQILVSNFDTSSIIAVGKMQTDCRDVRFTNSDGTTQLTYWIESGCNSASTKVWIKVPSVPAGDKKIYAYYGNPLATTASSWSQTMITFSANPAFTAFGTWSPSSFNVQENPGNTLALDNSYGDMRTVDAWTAQDEGANWVFDFGSSASRSFYVKWNNNATKILFYCVDFTTTISISPNNREYTTVATNKLTNTGSSSEFTSNYNGNHRYVRVQQYSTFPCMAGYGYSSVDAVWARNYASPEPTTAIGAEETF